MHLFDDCDCSMTQSIDRCSSIAIASHHATFTKKYVCLGELIEVCQLDWTIGFVATKDLLPILCEEDHVVAYGIQLSAIMPFRTRTSPTTTELYGLKLRHCPSV